MGADEGLGSGSSSVFAALEQRLGWEYCCFAGSSDQFVG